MTVLGVDLSSWNSSPPPDFAALYAAGVRFVIIKATESTDYVNPFYAQWREQARAAGLIVGAYHFARLGDVHAEAQWFLTNATPAVGDLVPSLDMEVTGGDIAAWSADWLGQVNAAVGAPGLEYLNQSLVAGYDWGRVVAMNDGLWLAKYDGVPDDGPQGPWPVLAVKQFTDSGQLPGLGGKVDEDAFEGDLDALRKYTIGAGSTPTPPPPPPPPPAPPRMAFPFGPGQYVGDINGPAESHGGYYAVEQPFVQNVQQWLIYHGCVPGQSDWHSGWADGKFEAPCSTDAAATWHARFYPGQPFPEQIWADDYDRLAQP